MAIDQTEKRRALVRQLTQSSGLLMDVLYSLDTFRRQRDTGGPGGAPMTFTDADFAGVQGLQHLDAATVNACFAAIPTLLTAFQNQNFDNVFEAMRP